MFAGQREIEKPEGAGVLGALGEVVIWESANSLTAVSLECPPGAGIFLGLVEVFL